MHTHFMRQWSTLSLLGIQEGFFATPLNREYTQLEEFAGLPDKSIILMFGKTPSPRHCQAKHNLAEQIVAKINGPLTQPGLHMKKSTVVDVTLMLLYLHQEQR